MSRSHRTPSQVDPASRSKHAPSAGEESGSIPEEMEHSVADSVLSDVALDVAEDDSLAEVLSGDNLRKPTGKHMKIFVIRLFEHATSLSSRMTYIL